MDAPPRRSRRRLLMAFGNLGVMATVAGCLDTGGDADSDETDDGAGDDDSSGADSGDDDSTGDDSGDGSMEDDSDDDGSTGDDSTDEDSTGDDSTDDGSTGDDSGDDGEEASLDLAEANVVDVSFEDSGGSYRFDVTLHHDDDGEEGYANWWQVERPDGTQLGRRELLHAHSQQPFTRSETIDIPSDVPCVVVRGHDQTHGYGGVAMVVTLDSGEMERVYQGEERQSLEDRACP